MNRPLFIIVSALFVSGCTAISSNETLKRAHIVPIYRNQVLLSATPEFFGLGHGLYDNPEFTAPKVWGFEKRDDGSTVVHWVSKSGTKERLALMDSGFHPIVVPESAITEFCESGKGIEGSEATVIQIEGTNSAFIPEHVTLVPFKSAPQ